MREESDGNMDEGGESGECRGGEGEGRSEMGLWMRVGSPGSVGMGRGRGRGGVRWGYG